MLSDEWLQRYRLLENFTAKWNGNGKWNGNAYDRGDYNSSFALRAVQLKMKIIQKSSKNCHFYSREKLQYIARACFRNGDQYIHLANMCKRVSLTLDLKIVFTEAYISLLQIKDSGILIRTSSMRGFYRVPTLYVLSKNKIKII